MRRRSWNRIDVAHVLALDRDGAAVGLDQPVRQPQQRGLARAGAADDGQKFALGDLERDVVHGPTARTAAAVERLADMRVGDQRELACDLDFLTLTLQGG